jgi:hypothetical protein
MVTFTPRPLYARGNCLRYQLDRRLGWARALPGRCVEEKHTCPYRKSNPGRPARRIVTILTELPRLRTYITSLSVIFSLFPTINCKICWFRKAQGTVKLNLTTNPECNRLSASMFSMFYSVTPKRGMCFKICRGQLIKPLPSQFSF